MARTFIRQDTQIRRSDVYDDTLAPSAANFETNPVHIEDDLNALRSMASHLLDVQAGNWFDVISTPSALETGTQRGVSDLNSALHLVEKKRVLREEVNITPITVGAGNNFVILGSGELPNNTIAAVGAVTTLGTVVAAHGGTFGTHSLDEVAGSSAVSPKNLVAIVDDVTHDPILSGGNKVYGLLQSENASDGHTIGITTPNRIQISFVRINGAGNDLEAVPFADIENEVIHYFPVERARLEDLNEQDFLTGRIIDVPTGSTVSRQVSYDNQGTTPVDLTTNATLDLEGAGLEWKIRDDLEADLFGIVEGSAGGTSQVNIYAGVDEFDVDAAVNDFANGATLNSGGTRPITVGVTDGEVTTTAGDLMVRAAAELLLDDGNQTGSTWAQDGIKLSEDTAEWDAFEVEFGEVSLLNAITQAANAGARGVKVYANVTSTTVADTDVGGTAGGANLDAQLPDMSGGTFTSDYDLFLNGNLQRPGADASANHDYYPGTSLALGQVKFEFTVKINDVIAVIPYA